MRTGLIYHAFDTESGRAWVGQTWQSLNERKYYHLRKSSACTVFRNALLKRPDSFVWTILVSGLQTQKELDDAEIVFIKAFDTLFPNGFNLKHGGSRGRNTAEMNARISAGMRGKNTWTRGRKQSPETIAKRVETTKSRGNTQKGKIQSDETRAKMRAGWKARRERLNGTQS